MHLPAYRADTMKVAELRRRYPAAKFLPALYGANAWWISRRWSARFRPAFPVVGQF
jgi:hypothetical protein